MHSSTGAQIAAGIRALANQIDVQEVAVVTWAHDEAARRRHYDLLAQTFDMVAAGGIPHDSDASTLAVS